MLLFTDPIAGRLFMIYERTGRRRHGEQPWTTQALVIEREYYDDYQNLLTSKQLLEQTHMSNWHSIVPP